MKTGIYQIRNIKSIKRYLGSAARAFDYRWNNHINTLCHKIHHSAHLQNAWNKYGAEAFVFEVIEYVTRLDWMTDKQWKDLILEREQYYLDTLLFASCNDNRFHELGYNICRVAGSTLGVKLSDQTRQRMSVAKRGIGNYCTKLTMEDVKQIISLLVDGPLTIQCIADQFNVSKGTVSGILYGKTWRHINLEDELMSKLIKRRKVGKRYRLSMDEFQALKLESKRGLVSQKHLAIKYHVSQAYVSDVKLGKRLNNGS